MTAVTVHNIDNGSLWGILSHPESAPTPRSSLSTIAYFSRREASAVSIDDQKSAVLDIASLTNEETYSRICDVFLTQIEIDAT